MSTSSRLLQLLSLLQARRDWPGEALAARLEVSPRTVRRDVERLRDMGYRVVAAKGPDGGYRLDRGSELPPLLFDDEQAIALAIALKAAVQTGAGVGDAAVRALATVRQVLPSHLRHRVDALEFDAMASPGRGTTPPADAGALLTISEAIRARREVRFDYSSPSATGAASYPAPRRAQPHHLVAVEGRWYVIAWEEAIGDWRLFRVDRMSIREHAGARFEPKEVPGGDAHAFVAARFMGGRPGEGWPCVGRAVVHLPLGGVAPYVPAGSATAIDLERCLVEAGSWSWDGLAAWFMHFDAELTDVRPRELADAFGRLAARAAGASASERSESGGTGSARTGLPDAVP